MPCTSHSLTFSSHHILVLYSSSSSCTLNFPCTCLVLYLTYNTPYYVHIPCIYSPCTWIAFVSKPLTLYLPRCLTRQVKVTSRPRMTVMLSTGSINSGSGVPGGCWTGGGSAYGGARKVLNCRKCLVNEGVAKCWTGRRVQHNRVSVGVELGELFRLLHWEKSYNTYNKNIIFVAKWTKYH